MNSKVALALSGGGHYGIAFHIGYLKGLFDKGIDLRTVDYIIGTSAGSQVSTTISSMIDWDTIWQEQIIEKVNETTPISDKEMGELFQAFDQLAKESKSTKAWVDGMGEISKNTQPNVSLDARRDMIRNRLGSVPLEWNDKLNIVATELETSERKVFNAQSGVALIDALAASSALQGVWQPIPINGYHYYDGGSYSMENPDVVDDAVKVIVLTTNLPIETPYALDQLVEQMKADGKDVYVVKPSDEVVSILQAYQYNTVNADMREEIAQAAVKQGATDYEQLKSFFNA
ncbi:patatin-like phospholipase family protein [Staphylococcus warneri]|uniref:patatin-like phospholipase family protein n=1 Tax=Staphylococcus warneri TaxID=1292 RepID=UPI001FB1A9CE|nr:patatin-like phospholipase family protein [Staphylococcus warneri]MCJ1787611.1 patatin-like phospholipase family protein [Staphylococcus warneri]MCJ1790104.1 patatin-like phospholipase family protein [Staphylococcus warneri]MCJ1792503.1 patatin-like phospholipase family protein [Staphylococcus warneri]MCJ1794991.1 patatin-like phospholipase family protein [Staphylococcus warneri]MCJ1797303.1 patatin-like phospholipase family protein [Staphylococcus warneri]